MSCPYYYWNVNHVACRKVGGDVDQAFYDKYCKYDYYDYSDCPIYKGETTSGSSGGCFLTSACVEARGLPDDCRELTVLRNFRDSYMKSTEKGQCDICEYYHTAPAIVDKIKKLPNALEIFDSIYNDLVIPCVALIDDGKNEEAYGAYKNYVYYLRNKYLLN